MSRDPAKNFAPIQDDYAFFMKHSNEQERDVEAFADVLLNLPVTTQRVLDFGCGPGRFTRRLLERMSWTGARCTIALVEPVDDYRAAAVAGLQPVVNQAIEAHPSIPEQAFGPFDVIVSNHVLYYVTNLEHTLARLCSLRANPGIFATALAGNDNHLIQMWHRGFALAGVPMPYHVAEDVVVALNRLTISYQSRIVPYDLIFEDNIENRMRILRFLFAQHMNRLPMKELLASFEPFVESGRVAIRTHDLHIAARV